MKSLPFEKYNINVYSDNYFNNQDRFQDDDWAEYTPVDLNAAIVPQGKSLSNLKKTQANIRERFALGK